MMSAVRFDGSTVRVDEIRRARPGAGQVLIRVTSVAVDRTDAEPRTGSRPVRLGPTGRRTLGRHAIGSVAALGVGVDGWPLGRAVVLQPEMWWGRGSFVPGVDHDGALAQYIAAPAQALVALPSDLSASTAVQLPLAARAGSMLAHARLSAGESVGIWGAGALGSAGLAVAHALGAAPIVVMDPSREARARAHDLGADACLDPREGDLPERVKQLTGRRGFDVTLHAAPDPVAAEQVLAGLGPQGRGVLAGPAQHIGGMERWDGRTLSGAPRVDPAVLPRLVHLVSLGRLHLPAGPTSPGGLPAAAQLIDAAVRGGSAMTPLVLHP
jgi:NADPH:quinone reductase-like Zn-dependent oxidoreductase